jgi:archaetidylinositol phosphate synthase
MIEAYFRKNYEKMCIEPLLKTKALERIHPHYLTIAACLTGISVAALLYFEHPFFAFAALAISGFLDTLDGCLARRTSRASSQGAALDILCDRLVEFSIIFGLYLVAPTSRALPTILMLGSILICVTSFLVVGIFQSNTSEKSFFYSPGLIERAEAFLFFSAMILFPIAFTSLAYLFSILVFFTAWFRMIQFIRH